MFHETEAETITEDNIYDYELQGYSDASFQEVDSIQRKNADTGKEQYARDFDLIQEPLREEKRQEN